MALSFRTKTFQDTLTEIGEKISSGELQEKDIDSFVVDKGINLEDFVSAEKDYLKAIDSGEEDFRAMQFSDKDLFGPDKELESLYRTSGRFLGETGRGLVSFGDAVLPEQLTDII